MEMKTGWPQLVWYFMTVMGVVLVAMKQGQIQKANAGAAFFGIGCVLGLY